MHLRRIHGSRMLSALDVQSHTSTNQGHSTDPLAAIELQLDKLTLADVQPSVTLQVPKSSHSQITEALIAMEQQMEQLTLSAQKSSPNSNDLFIDIASPTSSTKSDNSGDAEFKQESDNESPASLPAIKSPTYQDPKWLVEYRQWLWVNKQTDGLDFLNEIRKAVKHQEAERASYNKYTTWS